MKINFILEDGRYGGPHAYAVNIINGLKKNHDIEILLPKNSSLVLIDKLDNYQIQYKLLPLTHLTKQFFPFVKYVLFSLFEVINLIALFKKNKIDLVYVCGGSWQIKGVIAAKLSNTKVIWHLNDTYTPKIILYIFKFLGSIPNAYICASEATKKYYSAFIDKKKSIYVIPSPVDTNYFSKKNTYNHEPLNSNNQINIGIIANVNPIKGLEMFVQVAASLNQNYNNLKFVVIGAVWQSQKAYFLKIKAMAQHFKIENIDFIGQVDDVRPYLSNFDLYLCTSTFESSPISIWEAMSMECAIVSTDVGDVSLLIESNISGEIVGVGDINDMVRKTSFILDNPKIMNRYKSKCREIAIENLDVKLCVAYHLKVFDSLDRGQL